jgi:putative hydrolase of the HAD superfamily
MKNIVFDIGNVLVKWSPSDIVETLFPEEPDKEALTLKIFKSPIWYDLNLGKLKIDEAIQLYKNELPSHSKQISSLFEVVKESLIPLKGSFELLQKIHETGRPLYSITDNINEIMVYLRARYSFWDKFKGVIVSAEEGVLKPNPQIYQTLLIRYGLVASDTLFLDDFEKNVIGAREVGMHAIQFTTAEACQKILQDHYGIVL